jgi:hypothetical protein
MRRAVNGWRPRCAAARLPGVTFVPGLELCRRLHTDAVAPLLARRLPDLRYAAARIDSGSELLGFDTARSTDHDWGPRLQLFVPDDTAARTVRAVLDADLPDTVAGHPTRFRADPDAGLGVLDPAGRAHGVTVGRLDAFLRARLGTDPRDGWSDADWLATPTQRLAELTGGAVYADPHGELAVVRRLLAWYPDDVWRRVLAAQWQRVWQQEPFVGRCGEAGDELGSAVVAARLARDLMRLCLLLARRYPPYDKWLGTAFARLPGIAATRDALTAALVARSWPAREDGLCAAYESVAARSNASGLHEPQDPTVRGFHGRPYRVLGADRFVRALNVGGDVLGAVDQWADSTDLTGDPGRFRAVAYALRPPSA